MKLFRKLKGKKGDKGDSPPLSETASLRSALPPISNTTQPPAPAPQPSKSVPPAPPVQVLPSSNICQSCFHLDPTLAPRSGNPSANDPSWAVLEYNLPPSTPAAKAVPKSADLIRTAQNGCIHCVIIRSALSAVCPTWESEDTIVTIHLATGVPVVVRLEFGKYVEKTMSSEESMRTYGHGVPVKFMISLVHPTKKFEVEIYRPVEGMGEGTGSGDEGTGFDVSSLVEYMGFGEDIPKHSGSEESLGFIKTHVERCVSEHNCGGEDGKLLPLLPDRVIWVQANTPSRIQLVETKGTFRAKYIALSYCWGPVSANTYLTDIESLPSRKAGISYDDLPPLLQDVVTCARALGIEYLWVDRLCIVQGPGGDFATQAPKMGEIYGNASLTIAAATGTSENDRILVERSVQGAGPYTLDLKLEGMGTLAVKIRRRTHRLGTEDHGGDYGRVSTRAWIWQERLLSSRTVFFTPSALKFECHRHSTWQGYSQNIFGHSWSTEIDLTSISLNSWLRLVAEFMQRNITHPSDRLPAIESVMRHITSRTGWTPFWGVFEEHLIPSLAWSAQSRAATSGKYPCRMNPAHYVPTWSWASVDGEITYLHALTDGAYAPLTMIDPKTYEVTAKNLNRATGAVTLVGRYVIGGITCTIEPNEQFSGTEDSRMGRYTHDYKVRVSGQHPDFLLDPDVALMPHEGDPAQPYTASVVRVPYGREYPMESWTGNCLVLLVATQKKKSLALVLGQSLRDPAGGWERIGLATGIEMAVWGEEHVKRGAVTVV